MPEHDDEEDFWGPDESEEQPTRRRGRGLTEQQRKATPIVAAAAALLLIVVIFVVARSSSDDKKGTSATSGPVASSDASQGSGAAPTTAKAAVAQWPKTLDFPPQEFYDNGKSATEPQPGTNPKPGVYLWEGFDGWQIRIVPGLGIGRVSGMVTGSAGTIVTKVTGADPSVATVDGTNVAFNVPPTNSVVSIEFVLGFFTPSTDVSINGDNGPLDPSQIYLGAKAVPAPSNPVTFKKTRR